MKLFPSLRYDDPRAAAEWLQRAFGLEPVQIHEDADGAVAHAEFRWGDAIVMFGPDRDDVFGRFAGKGWVYASCDDPDALLARARAAGAEVVMDLVDTDYGSRDFTVRDLEGNLWSFGTYEP